MLEDRQLHTIINIINEYSGREPLHRYLKSYFSAHREMGSRDRRRTADFIFNYYRIGKAAYSSSIEERLAIGNYLCSSVDSPLLQYCISKFMNGIKFEPQLNIEERLRNVKAVVP